MDIEFAGVTASYGHVVALDDFSLSIDDGELLALVGPSGSGKSTALRVLAGLQPLTTGAVRIGGRDVTQEAPAARGVAMVFQDYALYPHLTAGENIAFGLRVRKERDVPARVAAVARQLGIDAVLQRYPDQLSGGQQQRVALARAMIREPMAYLMDEPLSNLDAQLRHTTRADIVELQRRLGATTLYVTHDQAEAMTMGDRVAVVDNGRLQQVGVPQEIYDRPVNRFVAGFLGSPPMNFADGGGIFGGAPGTVVGVRPEDLHLDGAGEVEMTVSVVESLGSETILTGTATDGQRLYVRTAPRTSAVAGTAVRLRVDTSRCHVFDASSGQRL